MPGSSKKHYLEEELEALIRTDPGMFRFLHESSLDGIWYWDITDPEQEWMSPQFWRLFGIDPATKQHLSSEWQDLIFPEDRDMALENFTKHCADPEHPYDQIVRYRHANGSTVWVRCRGMAIRDEKGNPVRMLGAHNDLTPRIRAEERYRAQVAATAEANAKAFQASETNRELRAISNAISHDMKAPSNTLLRLLDEVLQYLEDGKEAEARKLIELGRGTAERMHELAESLLNYNMVLERQTKQDAVDLNIVVEQILADLKVDVQDSGARFNLEPLPTIVGDAVHFRTILQNLIANAIRYRKNEVEPLVRISSSNSEEAGVLTISVEDNGIGIAPRFHNRVFEMFKRLHNQSDIPGSGLGLALSQRIVGLYGGSIELESEEGLGSTFHVRLPT